LHLGEVLLIDQEPAERDGDKRLANGIARALGGGDGVINPMPVDAALSVPLFTIWGETS
jgi:hypothetical protein